MCSPLISSGAVIVTVPSRILKVIIIYNNSRVDCFLTITWILSDEDFLPCEKASSKAIWRAWIGSLVFYSPLLSPGSCLELCDEIVSVLAAISIEILLGAWEYNGVTNISISFIEAIETPLECRSRTGRAESEAKKLEVIIACQTRLNKGSVGLSCCFIS
jgi:hypothetical protein